MFDLTGDAPEEPEVSFRFGHADDIAAIASLISVAGNGLFEYLLDDLVPRLSAIDFLKYAVSDSESPFSYANAILAERDDEVLGLALCYPGEEFGLPWVARRLIPSKRVEKIQALLDCKLDGTLYLNSLAVVESVRKMGAGRKLLGCVGELSQYLSLDTVTLHVWDKNEAAIRIYHEAGFKTNKFVHVVPDERLPFEGGMLQMEAKVPFVMTG
jgi:ribosomal protein S18 acetylase RimI-like enzyme